MAEIIKGCMFDDLARDYHAFFQYGPGAMRWSFDEGRRVLRFLAPPVGRTNPWARFETARIFCRRSATDWSQPGEVLGWDGNVVKPTFNPSIWLYDRKGWHGWIQRGDLVTA